MSLILKKLQGLQQLLDGKIDSAPAFIAGDQIHAWEILKNRPGTCKIAVGFEKGTARVNGPGLDITGRENQYYYAVISRGRGLNQVRSDNLIYGAGGGLPLFQLAEEMRDMMRAVRFNPTTDEVPDYVGIQPWGEKLGVIIDAFEVQIWVGTQLPQPASMTNNTPI